MTTLDYERLDAFKVALQLLVEAYRLTNGLKGHVAWVIKDHLIRAALSVLLNLAEGNGESHAGERAKFWTYSRRSADEAGACLIALTAVGLRTEEDVAKAKELVQRSVQMLVRMIQKTGASTLPSPSLS